MVKNIEFQRYLSRHNEFQQMLKEDANLINSSADVLVPADKTTDLYKVSKNSNLKKLTA